MQLKGWFDSAANVCLHTSRRCPHLCLPSSGGIAAYNAGDLNILPDQDVDARTTNGDYSNDVIARAQWYKREAFKS